MDRKHHIVHKNAHDLDSKSHTGFVPKLAHKLLVPGGKNKVIYNFLFPLLLFAY